MKTRDSLQRKYWLLAFIGLQALALWRGFGWWFLQPERLHVQ